MRTRRKSDIPYLFDGVGDLFEVDPCTKQAAVDELEIAWTKDWALQLTLILLDKDAEFTTRELAAECIDEFFEDAKVRDFVANRTLRQTSSRGSRFGDRDGHLKQKLASMF